MDIGEQQRVIIVETELEQEGQPILDEELPRPVEVETVATAQGWENDGGVPG